MRGITKDVYLESRRCLARGWYARALADEERLSEADLFRAEQGA